MPTKSILEVLKSGGVIVGDGSYIFTLGKKKNTFFRCAGIFPVAKTVKASLYTPSFS